MQKCIIISIRPEWVGKILSGEKIIEIRKSIPKCNYPIDVYIYCTKGKTNLYREYIEYWKYFDGAVAEPFMDQKQLRLTKEKYPEGVEKSPLTKVYRKKLNSKIVAKFTLNKVEEFDGIDVLMSEDLKMMLCGSCLSTKQAKEYSGGANIYTWHIDNLEIFNKPLKLSEFYRNNFDEDKTKPCCCGKKCQYESYDWCEHQSICSIDYDGANCPFLKVSKPPQSWCYSWR